MKTHLLIGVVVIVICGAVTVFFLRSDATPPVVTDEYGRVQVGGGMSGEGVEAAATIHRLTDRYEPKDVTIKQGETVSFVNDTDGFHWPASNVHPTHSIYSEFDPREPIGPGETWSFTFNQAGSWKYHDHLRANLVGTITVEPVH